MGKWIEHANGETTFRGPAAIVFGIPLLLGAGAMVLAVGFVIGVLGVVSLPAMAAYRLTHRGRYK